MNRDVSVIVPTLGRPDDAVVLSHALAALSPAPAESLFVFQDTNDRDRFLAQRPADAAKALLAPQKSAGFARNWGAEHASSPLLAFIDDDCLPCDERWLESLTEPLGDRSVIMTTGAVRGWVAASGRIPGFGRAFRLCPPFLEPFGRPDSALSGFCDTVAGGNFAVHRAQFLDAGGFSEVFKSPSLYEETELSVRMRRRLRGRIRYVPNAAVLHMQATSGGMRSTSQVVDRTFIERQRWLLLREVYGDTFSARLRFDVYRAVSWMVRSVRGRT